MSPKEEVVFNCKALIDVWRQNNAKKVEEAQGVSIHSHRLDGTTITIPTTFENAGLDLSNILYNNVDSSSVELVLTFSNGKEIVIGEVDVKH